MSSRRDTIEAEVLDAAFAKHGGESAWSAFGDGRLNPAEILEKKEEGDASPSAARAVVVGVMLDLVLEGWAKNNDRRLTTSSLKSSKTRRGLLLLSGTRAALVVFHSLGPSNDAAAGTRSRSW